MGERRKITDEREARRCLRAAARAGEPAGAWARAHGIDGRSLNAWRINLARRAATPKMSRPVPRWPPASLARGPAVVELVPASPVKAAAPFAVVVGELRVEVAGDFDPTTLQRLVQVLRAC